MDRRCVAEALRGIAGPFTDLVLLGEGHFTVAWLVDGTVVYRFAKHPEAVSSLRREACLLPQLAPHLPLKIPQPRYYEISHDPLIAIGAHDLLAGEPLTAERLSALSQHAEEDCAARIAQFLLAFHHSNLDLARRCGIQVRDYLSHYSGVAGDFEQHMARDLDEADRHYIGSVLDEFLSNEVAGLRSNALLHGDLDCSHILCDPQDDTVTAIIDFGDMIIADPAADLAGLYEHYGPKFMRRLVRHIPGANVEAMVRRLYRLYELAWIEWAVDVFEEQDQQHIELVRSELSRLRHDAPREVWRAMFSP